jgi:hypothetical protein
LVAAGCEVKGDCPGHPGFVLNGPYVNPVSAGDAAGTKLLFWTAATNPAPSQHAAILAADGTVTPVDLPYALRILASSPSGHLVETSTSDEALALVNASGVPQADVLPTRFTAPCALWDGSTYLVAGSTGPDLGVALLAADGTLGPPAATLASATCLAFVRVAGASWLLYRSAGIETRAVRLAAGGALDATTDHPLNVDRASSAAAVGADLLIVSAPAFDLVGPRIWRVPVAGGTPSLVIDLGAQADDENYPRLQATAFGPDAAMVLIDRTMGVWPRSGRLSLVRAWADGTADATPVGLLDDGTHAVAIATQVGAAVFTAVETNAVNDSLHSQAMVLSLSPKGTLIAGTAVVGQEELAAAHVPCTSDL